MADGERATAHEGNHGHGGEEADEVHNGPMRHDGRAAHGGHGDADAHSGQGDHDAHGGQGDHDDAHEGHDAHSGHGGHGGHGDHAAMFRRRFWVSAVLAVPIVVWAPMIQEWFGYTAPSFTASSATAPVLGTVLFFYGGWPFLTGAIQEARDRAPGMMLLIGMAISVAFGASLAAEFGWFEQELWWELALLIVVMLLGHWIEMRAIGQAQGALAALAELLPDEAERVTDDGEVEVVSLDDLHLDDVVLVRPGGRVPIDGVIVEGEVDVDESMITGESTPVRRGVDDRLVAGTVVADASVRVRVDAVGDDTALAGIERMIADAQASRSRAQALADRAAALLFYVAVAVAVVTAAVWLAVGEPGYAVNRTVTVLVIACPHALGLAIPLVTAISTARASRAGILVKDRLALERLRTVDTVLFDKTGTLTRGEHTVVDLTTVDGVGTDELLGLAGAVEADSEHPLARAIHSYAREQVGELPTARDFRAMPGRGVQAQLDGQLVAVGGPALIRAEELHLGDQLSAATEPWKRRGAAVLFVVRDGEPIGALALEDEVREASRGAIADLHEADVRVAMITGDAQQVADAVASDLGVDEVFAEVLPEDKDAKVAELQQRGRVVAMVGDGVNDAPALARADVGIAIGAGTDVAMESAGVVLASDDPNGVVAARRLSAATYRKMLQNLWWAAGYNLLALPLAAGVLAPIGFVMPMAVGAILMSASTVIVALNAQLLRRAPL